MPKYFTFPEGATPISDYSNLIPDWIHTLQDLNRLEAENIMCAQRKYLLKSIHSPEKWFHIKELKTIHHSMFNRVWSWAGKYRKSITSIGIKPSLIPMQLSELCHEVLSWLQHPVELTFVEMAARIHHRLVFIHPFENGNGRFSRLIGDRFLAAWECPYSIWPNQLNEESKIRSYYIQTLRAADKGDLQPLVHFMIKHGADNPKLSDLIKNSLYRPYLNKKLALFKALIRSSSTINDHNFLQLLIKEARLDSRSKLDLLKISVTHGAKIDAVDANGLTPFQVAVKKREKAIADFLLSKGARDKVPLHMYADYYNLYLRMPTSFN